MVFLLRVFLIAFIIYFLFRAIGRLAIVFLMGKQNANRNSRGYDRHHKKEGDVTVNYQPKNKHAFDKDEGEYIDYTEVK